MTMPNLDGEERHYNIRELDNLYRVTMDRHTGVDVPGGHWYVSYYKLVRGEDGGNWEYVPHSSTIGMPEHQALIEVEKMYREARVRLTRLKAL